MLINDLPDDSLLEIFKSINVLDVLIICSKVCLKWEYLIIKRLRTVKYLVGIPLVYGEDRNKQKLINPQDVLADIVRYEHLSYPRNSNSIIDLIYFKYEYIFNDIDVDQLLPNLKIVDVTDHCQSLHKPGYSGMTKLFKNSKLIKGIIHPLCGLGVILEELPNIEMIASSCLNDFKNCVNSYKIKQIFLFCDELDEFTPSVHHFPNIERLSLSNTSSGYCINRYNGPILEKLEIFEIFYSYPGAYEAVQFIDSCPALKSAIIHVDFTNILIDESIKLYKLEDLVIKIRNEYDINKLFRLIKKYPNLKHLSLENDETIKDADVKYLISNLKNLVLLDLRECYNITEASTGHVSEYCQRNNRQIKFYYKKDDNKRKIDYPKSSVYLGSIGRGFNFMENVFFGSWIKLLDPID